MNVDDGRRRRVIGAHRVAATAFRLAGGFGVVAAGWAVLVAFGGGSWWGPLHAFLAGSVLLAISGATQLFTVTWAAAPAPTRLLAGSQRWAVAGGVAAVLLGMATTSSWLVALGAVAVVTGLGMLAASLIGAVRRSLLRRFDLSARFYLLALVAGTVGVVLGGVIGSGYAGGWYPRLRLVHSHLNLVGLVGLTIVGTLPTILPTFAHHRAVSGGEAKAAWWLAVAAMATVGSGLVAGRGAVGIGSILAAASLGLVLSGVLFRLGKRGLQGGLPYLQVSAGSLWLVAWALVDGARLILGAPPQPFPQWTGAVVTAGVGQVLLGSLAYLVPVLVGPPPRLGHNQGRMMDRPWLPLTLANLAGLSLLVGAGAAAVSMVGLWALDFAYRLARLEWRDRATPG